MTNHKKSEERNEPMTKTYKTKQMYVACAKRGQTCVTKSRFVFGLQLIVTQRQNNSGHFRHSMKSHSMMTVKLESPAVY